MIWEDFIQYYGPVLTLGGSIVTGLFSVLVWSANRATLRALQMSQSDLDGKLENLKTSLAAELTQFESSLEELRESRRMIEMARSEMMGIAAELELQAEKRFDDNVEIITTYNKMLEIPQRIYLILFKYSPYLPDEERGKLKAWWEGYQTQLADVTERQDESAVGLAELQGLIRFLAEEWPKAEIVLDRNVALIGEKLRTTNFAPEKRVHSHN